MTGDRRSIDLTTSVSSTPGTDGPALDRAERDRLAFEEIDLYGELLIAAGSADRPLSDDEIDRALGLRAA